jgi:hypothetical protein
MFYHALVLLAICASQIAILGQMQGQLPFQAALNDPNWPNFEVIMPLSIAECEHFLLFYNISASVDPGFTWISFYSPADPNYVFWLTLPAGQGYIDWLCNIPAGDTITLYGNDIGGNNVPDACLYTVQPGSSSCVQAGASITSAFSYGSWSASDFAIFTLTGPPLVSQIK